MHQGVQKIQNAVLLAVALFGFGLQAETNVYTGSNGSWNTENWFKDSNWSLGHVPTGEDDVLVPTGKTVRAWSAAVAAKSLTVAGSGASLRIGDYKLAPQTIAAIGGNLTVTDGAVLEVYAGELTDLAVFKDAISSQTDAIAALYANPTVVSVGGTFTVSGGGIVYPYNALISGAAVFFKPKDFNLAADGLIDVRNRGWFCRTQMTAEETVPLGAREQYNSAYRTYSFCFGAGYQGSYGPGYGGKAYLRKDVTSSDKAASIDQPWQSGETYGNAYAPFLSGSMLGGWGYSYSRASGSIVILATGGVTLAGTLDADGRPTKNNDYDGGVTEAVTVYGGPSGGGIWVCGKTVDIAPTAVLTAKGGHVMRDWQIDTGCGGGGRISVGVDLQAADWDVLASTTDLPEGYIVSEIPIATCSVEGGHLNSGFSESKSEDGTITYVTKSAGKAKLTVASDPEGLIAAGVDYGTFTVAANEELTYLADTYGYDSANPDNVRYSLVGWTLTDKDGATTDSGVGSPAQFTLNETKGPYVLTWSWNNRETRHAVKANGPGTLTVNGTAAGTGTSIWSAASGMGTDTLVATAADGATFVGWFGVPGGKATTATVTVPDAEGANYVAVFAATSPALADKTWIGGTTGEWDDPASWSPSGVPTLADDVKIASGFCLASQGAVAHSIDIAAGAGFGLAAVLDPNTQVVAEDVRNSWATSRYLFVTGSVTCAGTAYYGATTETGADLWLEVGGDVALTGSAFAEVTALPCRAAEITTNALYEAATVFRIGGALSLAGSSKLEPRCDGFTGAAVRFEVGALDVAEGASVSAYELGWVWRAYAGEPDPRARWSGSRSGSANFETCAFSPGHTSSMGGSHGGCGNYWNSDPYRDCLVPYGFATAPFLPGSPKGFQDGNPVGGGGGVVWIKCVNEATVNGTLTASASTQTTGVYSGASGGSIWLLARGLVAGPHAVLQADGAYSAYPSAGAGGRICLGLGLTDEEIAALAVGELPSGVSMTEGISLIAASASGGGQNEGGKAEDGTLVTLMGAAANVTVNVAGSPLQAIGPNPDYGSQSFPGGQTVTLVATVDGYGYDPVDPQNIRYSCAGFEVRDLSGNLLTNGATSTLVYQVPQEETTVTWLWTNKQKAVRVDNPQGPTFGTVTINGVSQGEGGTSWGVDGQTVTVEAVPATGYEFLYWMGEFPYGNAKTNPLTVSQSDIRRFCPVFRLAEPPTTRIWKATGARTGSNNGIGCWLDPASWEPANIPGLEDDVIVDDWPGIPCYVTNNYVEVKSLTVEHCLWIGARPENAAHRFDWGPAYYFSKVTPRTEELSLVVTGSLAVNAGVNRELALGAQDQQVHGHLTVGGDLSLSSTAKLHVVAGPVTETFTRAGGTGQLTVGGTLAVTNASLVSLWSDPRTGGSVCVRANRVLVGEGAKISADCAGYAYTENKTVPPETIGVGYGDSIGGGYGGHGAMKAEPHYSETYGFTYGNPFAPVNPGASSGVSGAYSFRGGGLVRIHAKTMSIYGSVTANALSYDETGWNGIGAAAGGGIWLTADAFDFAMTTLLSARGGDSTASRHSEGGGGRISIGRGLTDAQIAALAGGAQRGVHRGKLADFILDFPVLTESSVNVKGGIGYAAGESVEAPEITSGTFTYTTPPHGLSIVVR